MPKLFRKLNAAQLIALGFLAVILIGSMLLMLPVASSDRVATSPLTCFFTATSATCVTGLVVVDTYIHWSLFGQIVILLMIQIGGLGIMTLVSIMAVLMHRRIGLYERTLLMQTTGALTHDGITHLIRRVLYGTLIFEGTGALLLCIRFIPKMGFLRGVWNATFHSISAFCNAGFDLMGKYGEFSSITTFADDPVVCLTLITLIVVGGIGFLVWEDIARHKLCFREYTLHTKIVLVTSAILLIAGTGLFLLFERNTAMAGMNFGERLLSSLFLSVTNRTAGFDNVGISGLSDSGALLSVMLMFIGGSPGSTAGGIKTTTLAVLLLDVFSLTAHRGNITVFKRRVDNEIVKRALAIATVYLLAILSATVLICAFEPFGLKEILFEVVSAIGTVGLSTGITPGLCVASRLIIMFLMYVGRIGGISLVLILGEKKRAELTQRPTENFLVG